MLDIECIGVGDLHFFHPVQSAASEAFCSFFKQHRAKLISPFHKSDFLSCIDCVWTEPWHWSHSAVSGYNALSACQGKRTEIFGVFHCLACTIRIGEVSPCVFENQ